jgi:glycosyltransferase involved in cell wall biosynthesis
MRVVHVITRLVLGGAQENTLYNCEDLLREYGDEVVLISGPAEGPEGDLFERARRTLDVRVIPELVRELAPWQDWRAYRRLKEAIRSIRPDVVHTHSSKAGILAREAAWRLKIPAVIHTIHGLPFHPYEKAWKNAVYVRAERRAARRCHRIITVADAMIEQAVAAGVAPREKFVTIPSGLEVETFLEPPRPREVVRAELGFAPDEIVIAKVARLFELKGHDDLLDLAPELFRERPAARLLFIGGGALEGHLRRRVGEAGLESKVVFTGLVRPARIPELLHAADIVAHASYREGLARVLPQGLLAGKPAVSYDVDGAREVVIPEVTGFLAPAGDRAQFAAALARLLDDPALRQRLGAAGRERCRERFRHQKMTADIRAEYAAILSGRK